MEREELDVQERFALDVASISQRIEERMRAYEVALRGIASIFSGDTEVPYAQWQDVMDRLQVQSLYPGISSIAWSRSLLDRNADDFVARQRATGRPDFRIFPPGRRETYQVIEYISPLTKRSGSVLGLDLLAEDIRSEVIKHTIDSAMPTLSEPLPLYTEISQPQSSPDTKRNIEQMGALLYFPIYRGSTPLPTIAERRATLVGIINAAFRGQELVRGLFGAQLRLFHISARDMQTNRLFFDSQPAEEADEAPGEQPRFQTRRTLPLYGRLWDVEITGTTEYERGLIAGRSHNFSLILGIVVALLLGILATTFLYQRDRQLYASQQVAARLRNQSRQLMLANRYKSEFLANMSHELRTPLNSILILSDQLRQNISGNLDKKQTRHADIVYRAGSDLLQLINDVLDLAKIEAGRIQINIEPVSLQEVLVDIEASMQPLAEAKGLHLHIASISPENGLPQKVHTDRVRLHQILRNLLSNAIKFTEQGQIRLMVSADAIIKEKGDNPPEDENRQIVINFMVCDTGIGIDPRNHTQVFEAFAQLDGSTRRRFGGTGLGLAITRQLTETLGGSIELQSALGQGSTFTVKLPVHVVHQPPQETLPLPQRSGEGPVLLIVEDDKNFADTIIEKAHASGFSSLHCLTGKQALDMLKHETFAAIILDLLLPDISGWQLFRRLRAQPKHLHTPVHIISCLPQPDRIEDEQGTHYLTKPVSRDTLEKIFDRLRKKQPAAPALLLVEDVDAERDYYSRRLSELGFTVTACSNAQMAKDSWRKNNFEVLVLDLNLPDQDGFTLLDSLDKLRSLSDTRIIVNTGVDVTYDGLQRLSSYSAVVVPKRGTDISQLGQAIQDFLGQINMHKNSDSVLLPSSALPDLSQTAASTLPGRRVLLVDDDVRNVYAMSALLDEFALEIITADNGEEAIRQFNEQKPDLILMDMSMPIMDGYTATNLLKQKYGCTIPIIAMTAHAMIGDREKCLAAGTDDYIAKPVKREELRVLLEHWLTTLPDYES